MFAGSYLSALSLILKLFRNFHGPCIPVTARPAEATAETRADAARMKAGAEVWEFPAGRLVFTVFDLGFLRLLEGNSRVRGVLELWGEL